MAGADVTGFVVWASDGEADAGQVVSVPLATADAAWAWGAEHCGGMTWDVCTVAEAAAWGMD